MEQLEQLQRFTARLNSEPAPESLEPTPDNRAKTVTISHIEMTLDELFFGQWSTKDFTWSAIANEVQGSLTLEVIHPVNGQKITRIGAASVVIMVDKVPQGIDGQERNQWAINPMNKKPNALDLAFPKLKAECLKNAAQSLGKIFGRDVNRKRQDVYRPFRIAPELPAATMLKIESDIANGVSEFDIRNALDILGTQVSDEQKQHINNLLNSRE